ncbi:hypothetical protein [Paraliomyxa miuraensis]|uniref:hypothetical protein n=1 Tax=Paraliomyxa miuraensis TaxID=376150 RepID=UPI002255A543|nr:hypothetical protein [Paraliomyxa miuraensis]MCX4240547.1 hypothetical protein [Paraliomyxa miuraensis]
MVGTGWDPVIDSSDSDGGSSGDGPAPVRRLVDILFVVDDSGSMGEEQAKLASGAAGLVAVLDTASPPIDYRVAVTTTDNGNPWCGSTSHEEGHFVATSCQQRAQDFVFEGVMTIDAYEEACLGACALPSLDLPQPWIDVERSTDTTNVPEGSVLEALECMLPQGISGCGFEQPLESMSRAILLSRTEGESEHGFRREGALLAVVLVTDEADCSYDADHETIFLPDGNRVFWSDPGAPAPTSAVCWNAGVVCSGGSCRSANLDEDANEVPDADADLDAVMHPVDRYLAQLGSEGALVMAINGVAPDGSVVYQDSMDDPGFQSDFGIGPGCESAAGRAVPPVRVHEVVDEFGGTGGARSICSDEFGSALASFAEEIVARLP